MRKNVSRVFALSFALTFVLLANFAFSQGIVTGSISGTVQDEQGAAIPKAAVTAVQDGTNAEFKAQSDGQGYYSIKALPIGTYKVSVTAPNFTKLNVNSVAVDSGRNTVLGAQVLKIGASTEVVNVEATAPLIDAASSQIGATFESKQVQELPNAGAGFDNLALFIPGMAQTSGSTSFSNTNGAGISSNGLRGRSNNFQIDGQSNNDNSVAGPAIFLSNPDIIGELQIVTNNFSAEYGRNTGSVVNYVTKSGTNAFHGSAFDYYTGSLFNSLTNSQKNPQFGFCPPGVAIGSATSTAPGGCKEAKTPRSNENRFGGTIGGPIWRDKAWFFGSYQGDRFRQGPSPSTSTTLTPTPAGIALLAATYPGNVAVKSLQTIGPYAVTTGNPTPAGTVSNVLVTDGVTPVTVPFSKVSRSVASLFNDKQITGRGDIQLSPKDRFFARYIYQQSLSTVGSGTVSSGAWVDVPSKEQQIGLDYTRTWSSHFVSQARLSYSRLFVGFEGGSAFPTCLASNLAACPTSIAINNGTGQVPGGNRGYGIANNLPQNRLVNHTQYSSNNTYSIGRHTIKFGGEFARQRSPNLFLPNNSGSFTFANFNSFIQNKSSSLSLAEGTKSFNFKEKDMSFYGQDDWRIKDNLTLNLGLRWEWNQQAINLLHDITVANQALTPSFWNTAISTDITEIPAIPQDLNNFGPNIGFAWTPRVFQSILGQDKTVIRGGYRIAYDPAFYNIFLNIASAAPVVNLGTITTGVGLPSTGFTGADVQAAYLSLIPRGGNPGTRSQTRVSPDFHNPYTQQWSLGIERQIGNHIGVESRYVGNHTIGNFETQNGNPLLTGIPASLLPAGVTPCATVGAPGFGRADCNFSLLRVRTNGAFSIYHGLQNRIDVRNLHGMTAGVEYTYSKAIDNVSEIFSNGTGISTPISQNPFDTTKGERGVSGQSFPNVFTTYWIYDLPWLKSQSGIVGKVLGGWQWGGTFRYQSGAPITPYQDATNGSCDTSFNAGFIGSVDSCRPIAGNPSAPFDSIGKYTSATNFIDVSTGLVTTPSAVRFIVNNSFADTNLCGGNPFACSISRDIYRGQPRNNVDLSLQKSTKLTETVNLHLRADMFNVFNNQFLGTPGLDINDGNFANNGDFGTTAFNGGTRRSMQLLVRISF
ncbi:MAG: TonB-dependent receptor plug [Acidobacteriaceae bacterium]|nr:TonB-dependent receptor plug [Acidobacteriaceae bacterium]